MVHHRLVPVLLALLALPVAPATAQNLLENPGFDTDLSGWAHVAAFTTWSPDDANGSPRSGSSRTVLPADDPYGVILEGQCLPVTGGTVYDLSFKVRLQQLVGAVASVRFHGSSGCTGAPLTGESTYNYGTGQPGQWLTVHKLEPAPGGAQSVEVSLYATTDGGAHTVYHDDVYFGPAAATACAPGVKTLCIDRVSGDRRFRVRSSYATVQAGGRQGEGTAIQLGGLGVDRGGLFWFFAADNPEALVKVLDGCAANGYFWVFIAAGTNVGVDILIGDTVTGAVALFRNPDLGAFPPVQDLYGLPCG